MRRQDQLIDLIHSLTPSEKRYFKLYVSLQPGSKKYTQLFDALLKQESYDAATLCRKLKLTKPQLANDKKYLEQVVIKALRAFNDKTSPEIMVQNALIDIGVLLAKNQYDMCEALMQSVRKICLEYELFPLLLECSKWEVRLYGQNQQVDKLSAQIEEKQREELDVIEKLKNYFEFKRLNNLMYSKIYRRGAVLSTQTVAEMDEIMHHPLMQDESKALTFQSKMWYYQVSVWYTMATSRLEESMELMRAHVNCCQKNIKKILPYPLQYARTLSVCALNFTMVGYYSDANRCITYMEKLPHLNGIILNENRRPAIQQLTVDMRLGIYTIRHEYSKGMGYFKKMLPLMIGKESDWSNKFFTHFYYYGAYCCFHCLQYDDALKYLRKLIDDRGKKKWADEMIAINMLHIIIHFELGNMELIPYLIKSLQQYMGKPQFKPKSIELFVKMFSTLIKQPFRKEQTLIFKDYLAKFEELSAINIEKAMQDGAGLRLWLQRRIG